MASKRHERRKACTGKIRHVDQTRAVGALLAMKKGGMDTTGLHTYKCPFCSGWHLGHRRDQ